MSSNFLRGTKRPLIFGHRGARAHAPENTLLAFDRAIDDGADGVELDVRCTACGTLCIHHDPSLTIAGRTLSISDLSYSQILALGAQDGARVCTLEEALKWAHGRNSLVNIELKAGGFASRWMADEAIRISRRFERESLLFSSFDLKLLFRLMTKAPELERGFLTEKGHPFLERSIQTLPLSLFSGAQALHPQVSQFSASWLKEKISRGLIVNTWTVVDKETAHKMDQIGVNALICDDPAMILEAFE